MRIGVDPANSNETVPAAVIPPHGSSEVQDKEEFLNGVTLAWQSKAEGATSDQFQQVTMRGSAWDDLLNTHCILTINSMHGLDATGSNTGVSSAGQGKKKIINKKGVKSALDSYRYLNESKADPFIDSTDL